MAFKESEPWQAFVDDCWEFAKTQTGFREESQCPIVLHARTLKGTISDVLPAADNRDSEDMLRWIALHALERVPAEMRLGLLVALGRRDPPSAAMVYQHRADLSAAEDAALVAAFAPSMPIARAKMEAGTLSRAKGGA